MQEFKCVFHIENASHKLLELVKFYYTKALFTTSVGKRRLWIRRSNSSSSKKFVCNLIELSDWSLCQSRVTDHNGKVEIGLKIDNSSLDLW